MTALPRGEELPCIPGTAGLVSWDPWSSRRDATASIPRGSRPFVPLPWLSAEKKVFFSLSVPQEKPIQGVRGGCDAASAGDILGRRR